MYVHYYIYFLQLSSVCGRWGRMAQDTAMVSTQEPVNSNSIACSSQAFIQQSKRKAVISLTVFNSEFGSIGASLLKMSSVNTGKQLNYEDISMECFYSPRQWPITVSSLLRKTDFSLRLHRKNAIPNNPNKAQLRVK